MLNQAGELAEKPIQVMFAYILSSNVYIQRKEQTPYQDICHASALVLLFQIRINVEPLLSVKT